MTTTLNPYLHFTGRAEEAMEFYRSVFGGELIKMTFAEYGGMGLPEEEQGGLMHGQLTTPQGTTLMGSDVPSDHRDQLIPVSAVALSGHPGDEALLRGWFDALSAGGQVHVPLDKAPWGDSFGQCADPFGHIWMVNIAGDHG